MGLYFRGGRLAGVTADGRKYRLQTLGIPDTFAADCAGWQRLPERLRALDEVALAQTRTRVRAHGFAEALLAVVSGGRPQRPGGRPQGTPRRPRCAPPPRLSRGPRGAATRLKPAPREGIPQAAQAAGELGKEGGERGFELRRPADH